MASTYPGTLDAFTNPGAGSLVTSPSHAAQHANVNDAMEAVQSTLGTTLGTSVLKNFTTGSFAEREGTLTFGANRYSMGTTALNQGSALFYNGTNIVGSALVTAGSAGTLVFGTNSYTLGTTALSQGSSLFYNGTNIVGSAGALNVLTSKGDVRVHNGTTETRIGSGSDGHVLAALSSAATGLTWRSFVAPTQQDVSDAAGGTISITYGDTLAMQQIVLGTAAGNRTLSLAAGVNNSPLTLKIKQNAAATGTLVWTATNMLFSSDIGTPSLGTASTWNYFGFRYGTTDTKWHFMGQSKNII